MACTELTMDSPYVLELIKGGFSRVREDILQCKNCILHETVTNKVISKGSESPSVVFIGEAPGKNEDETGVPFCGRAGKNLDEMIANLNDHALKVKQIVSPDEPMGIGLWLSANSAHDAIAENRLADLKAFLDESGLIPFTFNGFPYGDFHAPVVKHEVYKPDWLTLEDSIILSNWRTFFHNLRPRERELRYQHYRLAGQAEHVLTGSMKLPLNIF